MKSFKKYINENSSYLDTWDEPVGDMKSSARFEIYMKNGKTSPAHVVLDQHGKKTLVAAVNDAYNKEWPKREIDSNTVVKNLGKPWSSTRDRRNLPPFNTKNNR